MPLYTQTMITQIVYLAVAVLSGLLIGLILGFIFGKSWQKKAEPQAWQLQRHFKAEAERYAGKVVYLKSVLKSVQMSVAGVDLQEDQE